jgi:hypothetical protein
MFREEPVFGPKTNSSAWATRLSETQTDQSTREKNKILTQNGSSSLAIVKGNRAIDTSAWALLLFLRTKRFSSREEKPVFPLRCFSSLAETLILEQNHISSREEPYPEAKSKESAPAFVLLERPDEPASREEKRVLATCYESARE